MFFEDLGFRHPFEYLNPATRRIAILDMDFEGAENDPDEGIQTTILRLTEHQDENQITDKH